MVYITVVSNSKDEHCMHFEEAFSRIQSYGSHIQMEKCMFLLQRISLLVPIKYENDRIPDSNEIVMLQYLPAPPNKWMLSFS